MYWAEPQLVADATLSALRTVGAPAWHLAFPWQWFNPGPFGVALFFLISGFVIPMSLERQSRVGFLIARAFRIFPPYVTAFAIELAIVAASGAYWHRPFTFGIRDLLANAFLVTDIVNVPSLDLVNWTLTVELKFYLLMALLIVPVRRGNVAALFGLGVAILFVSRFSHEIFLLVPGLGLLLRIFESNALYVLFMLIGVLFSFHARGKIVAVVLVPAVLAMFAMFVVCWPLTFFRGEYPWATLNYGYGLLVFGLAYAFRSVARDNRVVDFFADISYPLYLVHALVGFALMQALVAAGYGALPASAAAFAVAVALATALHHAIERPSQGLGKALAARVAPGPGPAARARGNRVPTNVVEGDRRLPRNGAEP